MQRLGVALARRHVTLITARCVASIGLISIALPCHGGPRDLELQAALAQLTPAELRRDLTVLAADALGGRGAGYPGEARAARYAAGSFADDGLQPLGDRVGRRRTYLQSFTFFPQHPPRPRIELQSENVLGLLPGSDVQLSKEVVVVGAHHDGQGRLGEADPDRSPPAPEQAGHTIWNSADDNASGMVTVLAIARALHRAGVAPRRSILFATFGAEEHGLLGSLHYVNHPAVPWSRHVAMLTFEQMGREPRRDPIVMAAGTSSAWDQAIQWANALSGLSVRVLTPELIQDTDHYGFGVRGVPALSMGIELSPDAHRNTDTADKIDFDALTARARFALSVIWWLANTADRPVYAGIPPCGDRRLDPGLEIRCSDRNDPGLEVTTLTESEKAELRLPPGASPLKVVGIVDGLPAATAALRPGDVIVAMNGTPLSGAHSLRVVHQAMASSASGVRLRIERGQHSLEVTLEPAANGTSSSGPSQPLTPSSDASQEERWDVQKARGHTRRIHFTTDEGTFESVDISPDGAWILFDLLGQIYRVPARGGPAECLTQNSGAALNYHPRYSPDGTRIAFVSDRIGGQDNLWIMNADGTQPRPLFLDRGSRVRQPAWTPDGKGLIAVRVWPTVLDWEFHRTTLARFSLDGAAPHELLSSPDWQYYWPAITPDGAYVYFYRATMMRPDDGVTERQQIQRLELATGRIDNVTAAKEAPVSFGPDLVDFAPEISPDGRWLAFGRRVLAGSVDIRGHPYNVRTALWLRDLTSGTERVLMDPIESDATQGNSVRHMKVLPGYRWAADSRSLIVPQGGHLHRVWLDSGRIDTIPFTAVVDREISESVRSSTRLSDGPLAARFLRWPTSSPDGKQLVFEALGRIWTMSLPNGAAHRLLSEHLHGFEYMPAFSPDGRWIAYVTWSDSERGAVWKVPARGGEPQPLSRSAGEYVNPVWSLDSRSLLVTCGDGATARGEGFAGIQQWHLVRMASEARSEETLAALSGAIRASSVPGGVIYPELHEAGDLLSATRDGAFDHLEWILHRMPQPELPSATEAPSMRVEGRGPAPAEGGDWMANVAISPDAHWVAYVDRFNVYLAPWHPELDGHVSLTPRSSGVRRLSRQGGLYPSWRNASTVQFMSGARYYVYHLDGGALETHLIDLRVPRPIPQGTLALQGARIISMNRGEVIPDGTVLVRGARIVCVGQCDVRQSDRVVDVRGKTIIPGLVDMHAHHLREVTGMIPEHRHESARYLAHGVTTVLDPATWADPAFPIAELIEAGDLLGPRTYSVGNAVAGFGGRSDIESYTDAEDTIARLTSWGAVSIKDYLQPSRRERQMLARAARQSGVTITAEGEDLFRDLALVIDGHPGWEHNLPYTPLYRDAAEFFGMAGVVYSATLNVSSPALRGQEYHEVRSGLLTDPKQQHWVPASELAHANYHMMRPLADYAFPILAQGLADIVHAGGQAAVGGHGEWPGLDTHWDLWSEATALSPAEALRNATLGGASFVGLDRDIGSIQVGKVADLVVLDADPLEDIHNTRRIRYVMKSGRLYEADTLDEIWPESRPYGPRPWVTAMPLPAPARTR